MKSGKWEIMGESDGEWKRKQGVLKSSELYSPAEARKFSTWV